MYVRVNVDRTIGVSGKNYAEICENYQIITPLCLGV